MEKLDNQHNQSPEMGEKKIKKMSDFDFQIPKKEIENGFIADQEGSFNEVIEYSEFNNTLYPGKFQEGKRESVNAMEEENFMLITTCYADDLYAVIVVNNNRDAEAYPPASYPQEMVDLLTQVEEKRDIRFPLTSFSPEHFKDNSIILSKRQLKDFIEDMKLDDKKFFQEEDMHIAEDDQDTYEKTEDGYEIKNILPTQFLEKGTFRNKKVPIVEGNNEDIYINATMQEISGSELSVAGLDTLIREVKLICMPDDIIKVSLEYKPGIQSIRDVPEIIAGNSEHGKLFKFTEFLQKNIKKQIEISQKWGIHLPLSSMLNLVEDTSKEILLEKSQIKELLKDLGIHVPVVLPISTEGDKESATLVSQDVLDEKKRQEDKAEKIKLQEEEMKRKERAMIMMKCVLDDDVVCDINYVQDQKYILVHDEYGVKIVSHNMEYHKDIAEYIGAIKKNVHGGGRIKIDEIAKTITLYGESTEFKKVAEDYHEVVLHILQKQYPEYTIQIQ